MSFRLAFALVFLAVSVQFLSPRSASAFPWSIDMYRGAAVQTFAAAPRVMPSDTLPVHGEPELTRDQATLKLHNPLNATPDNLAAGKQLFETNCQACHGASGAGDGPVVKAGLLTHPPSNLLTGTARELPDGYIFGTIRAGASTMPSFADAMSPTESWQVVVYLRSLQSTNASR